MKSKVYLALIFSTVSVLGMSSTYAQIPKGASFWLKADTGILAFNNVVSEWKDQSGTTKSAFQALPLARPTRVPASLNGLPVVHFDGRSNYMDCPPIFPTLSDYTVSFVLKLGSQRYSNIFSGNTHEFSISQYGYLSVYHDTSISVANSTIALQTQPSIVTVTFRESDQYATFFINGQAAGSGFVGKNHDSTLYLGAYQSAASFAGDVGEVILYKKVLNEAERKQMENYLFNKYAIAPPPAADSVFTNIPKHLQFFARGDDNFVTVPITGNIYDPGYDSIYLSSFKDGALIERNSLPLHYTGAKASFSFLPRIHAELSEYSFRIAIKSSDEDRLIAFRDSIVCGDVILINGQSNSISNNLGYTNEFFRTFGRNFSHSTADTSWAVASTAVDFGGNTEVGSWGLRLQEQIMNTYRIPTCVINGGVGGTTILQHQPDPLNHTNLNTIYGSMLYRTQVAGLATKAKVLFWYQGESDVIANYSDNFRKLYEAWKVDYPSVRKIYVMQVRIGCSAGYSADVRDMLRTLQDTFPNIESVSTMGLPGHDGCHFAAQGYSQLGDQLFLLLSRDFYGSSDRSQISSPNIHQAYFTDVTHTRIGLTFWPTETRFNVPGDTTISGVTAKLKDYFFLGDSGAVVQNISTSRNRIFLDLKVPATERKLTYLPDKYYLGTSAIYEGPWLTNNRGIGAFSFYHVLIVDSAQAGVGSETLDNNVVQVYPNPSHESCTVRFFNRNADVVTISIFDVLGNQLFNISPQNSTVGYSQEFLSFESMKLSSGVYELNVRVGNNTRTARMIISR